MAYESVKINGLNVSVQTWVTSTRVRVCEHAMVRVERQNGEHIQCEARDYWYNRPWYEYQFQNALEGACYRVYTSIAYDLQLDLMYERGWKRVTGKRALEINAYVEPRIQNTPIEVLLYLVKNHYKVRDGAGYRERDICRNLDHIEAKNDGSHQLIEFFDYEGASCTWDRSTNRFVN